MRTAIVLIVLVMLPLAAVAAQSPTRGPVITPGNAAQLELIATLGRGSVRGLLWTDDDRQLMVVSNNALSVYTAGEWDTPQIVLPDSPALVDAGLSPDGREIALIENGQVRVLDTVTWAELLRYETITHQGSNGAATIGHSGDHLIHWNPATSRFEVHDRYTGEEIGTIYSPGGIYQHVNRSEPFFAVHLESRFLTYADASLDDLLLPDDPLVDFPPGGSASYQQVDRITGVDYRQQRLAVTGEQGMTGYLMVDDVQTDERLAEIATDRVRGVALSPIGDRAAVGLCVDQLEYCQSYQVAVIDYASGEQTILPGLFLGGTAAMQYDHAGRYLAAASGLAVRVWDTATGEELALLPGFSTTAQQIALNDDLLAVRTQHYTTPYGVTLWDLHTLEAVTYLPCKGAIALYEKTLVCGTEVWQIDDPPRLLYRLPDLETVHDAVFNGDGSLLAITDRYPHLMLWDMNAREYVASVSSVNAEELVFSADDRRLISHNRGTFLLVWDVAALLAAPETVVPKFDDSEALHAYLDSMTVLKRVPVENATAMAAHPGDPDRILLHGLSGEIRFADVTTGDYARTIQYWTNSIFNDIPLAYSPDGSLIAGGRCSDEPAGGFCTQSDLKVFDAETGEPLFTAVRDNDLVRAVGFTPDGRWLVSGHGPLYGVILGPLRDCNLHVWGIKTP